MQHFLRGTTPAGLTDAGVRHLNHEKNVPEFNLLGAGIERMGELHKALSTIRATSDSRQTPEARAFRYKTVRDQALAKVGLINAQARKALDDRRERLRGEAFKKSGLLETYPQAQEVRQVLRGLSQKERDAEINAAIDRGDVWVIAAIRNFPPLLTGKIGMPISLIENLIIAKVAPELDAELEDLKTAETHLDIAVDTFAREAERMRDIEAEGRAVKDARATAEADAAFAKALGAPVE
ncbi:hypothetical protein [Mesorhizobium sp.]|uniref:hypothetical protein n=1 Tax=Mesorhizobium sp. TaxID=1871066 RepID=UPI000FE8E3AB|nr:hypothetical protein [Mesorhizobium sp.]RWM57439.1 MAG: hypothetical protein EOR78_09205 [Mesorhizobium sp.]RWM59081.1 MAG: hypothetical protein EOR79_12225 [Mesorhizobium sp.]RWM93318.1 MAG: hypothetical protein EOR85_27090 [Mesorhizobium sp.]TIO70369.1 MAG: hypothetical protein E5X85_07510 [Mesorhizobium sp.]TJV92038.1 MAG: hypothetical protein E5X84_08520 [Mesorhizobium sp.]